MADVYSKAKRSEIMSRVKNRRTLPEEVVAGLLRKLKVRYRRNVSMLPGSPDFAVHKAKVAVFVHGCFWHGHPNCKRAKLPESNREFWERKIAGNRRRDARNCNRLRKEGWRVLTVWQCRLHKEKQVMHRLQRELDRVH